MTNDIRAPFYNGISMQGTFLPADWLIFELVPFNSIHHGDVLIFFHQNKKRFVHRVMQIRKEGVVTQGDNNLNPDINLLKMECFIGRVIKYERNGNIHKVWNGRLGMLRARMLHGRLHAIRAIKLLLRKPYRLLKKTGIVSLLWRPGIEKIQFETPDGALVKYVHKGRTVAGCWTNTNRWWFRRPYDFVIGPKFRS